MKKPFKSNKSSSNKSSHSKGGEKKYSPQNKPKSGEYDKPKFERRNAEDKPSYSKEGEKKYNSQNRPKSGEYDKPKFERRNTEDKPSYSKDGEKKYSPQNRPKSGERDKPKFERRNTEDKPSYSKDGEKKYSPQNRPRSGEYGKPKFERRNTEDKPSYSKDGEKKYNPQNRQKTDFDRKLENYQEKRTKKENQGNTQENPQGKKSYDNPEKRSYRSKGYEERKNTSGQRNRVGGYKDQPAENAPKRKFVRKPFVKRDTQDTPDYQNLKNRLPKNIREKAENKEKDVLRLNQFIAKAGVCSRREADELIKKGEITVNGEVITEMGYQVKKTDKVYHKKIRLNSEKMVYVLLNKPKNYLTTTSDPEERKIILDLVKDAGKERIYPVGRLDRNTTGLILLTNDGDLAQKLAHPSNKVPKIYQVELDKPITEKDFEQILAGLELKDGPITVDKIAILTADAQTLGIEIHSGRNRIVRRIFEHLGYEVTKLDRTYYAGLDKKNLKRGDWRYLTEQEVVRMKYFN